MLTAVIAVAVVGLALAVVVVVAREPGPTPGEVAIAYELAWDRLDFDALWTLSATELRDGRAKPEFVHSKREAYRTRTELRALAERVALDDVETSGLTAVAHTRVELRDGGIVRNEVRLAERDRRWQVVAYELRSDQPA